MRTALCLLVLLPCLVLAQDEGAPDPGQAIVDALKQTATQYRMQLPPEPKVGLWWEYTASGTTLRYAITAERGGKFVVEQTQDMGTLTLVNAWLVDPNVDLSVGAEDGKPLPNNVRKAWIGIQGKRATERPVMEAPVHDAEAAGPPPEVTTSEEELELAGRTWQATVSEIKGSKSWFMKRAQFMLKTSYKGKVMLELSAMGEDATSQLTWPEPEPKK